MLAYAVAVNPVDSWYTMVIKERDERYGDFVESYEPEKLKVLVDLRNSREVQESESYISLKQTITINIVNFTQFNTTDAFHTRFELYDMSRR